MPRKPKKAPPKSSRKLKPSSSTRTIRLADSRWSAINKLPNPEGLSINAIIAQVVDAGLTARGVRLPVDP